VITLKEKTAMTRTDARDHQTQMAVETGQAPAAVARLLEANRAICQRLAERFVATPPRLMATCARGSSDHAATYGKYMIETSLGVPVLSAAPSIGSVYGRPMALDDSLFILISQSGQSPDLVANARWAKQNGAVVIALLNVVDSPVGDAADEVVPLHAGPETSVAATKSYIAALAALAQLTAYLSDNQQLQEALELLPAQLEQAAGLDWDQAVAPLASADDLLVVGRGLGFGIAQEAALKFKETASIHAEAFSAAELMHGPLALVRDGYPVLAFSQADETREPLRQLVDTLRGKGAKVFTAEAGAPAPLRLPVVADMHPATAPIAMIQSFYGLANKVALARGFDPDHPPHLKKVTETR
jgi:glucosamine--fructose-6-phosphate aminotransferase (isomerizing)